MVQVLMKQEVVKTTATIVDTFKSPTTSALIGSLARADRTYTIVKVIDLCTLFHFGVRVELTWIAAIFVGHMDLCGEW